MSVIGYLKQLTTKKVGNYVSIDYHNFKRTFSLYIGLSLDDSNNQCLHTLHFISYIQPKLTTEDMNKEGAI